LAHQVLLELEELQVLQARQVLLELEELQVLQAPAVLHVKVIL
jgi:hypothetical protein